MARTTHTPRRTAGERAERVAATRHRDHTTRRATTRAAALAAIMAEYDTPPLVRTTSGAVELRGRSPLVATVSGSVELAGRHL